MASLRERLMGLTSDSGNSFNTSLRPEGGMPGKRTIAIAVSRT
jgi:hypothetical protein